jgi:hypothetical protein
MPFTRTECVTLAATEWATTPNQLLRMTAREKHANTWQRLKDKGESNVESKAIPLTGRGGL